MPTLNFGALCKDERCLQIKRIDLCSLLKVLNETLRKNEQTTEAQRAGFRKAVSAGVRIAFGTDSGVYPHGMNAIQLPYMVRHGMTPLGAVRAATVVAAEMMGWGDRVGSLSVGHYADLLAVPGDPFAATDGSALATLLDPTVVMKGGAIVRDDRGVRDVPPVSEPPPGR